MNINEGVGKAYLDVVLGCVKGQNLDPLLDRLILEVRAEMPCSVDWMNEHRLYGGTGFTFLPCSDTPDPCPSCTARTELAKEKPFKVGFTQQVESYHLPKDPP